MTSNNNVLEQMRPAGWSGLYVVGSFDRRITFWTQQVRALELVRALFESGEVQAGQRVGIVGAGAAGVTAAVAAARKGCLVTLFDEKQAILHLQSSTAHRFLHPHIYDWPAEGAENQDAGLPLLNWKAGEVRTIVEQLRGEFARVQKDFPLPRLNFQSQSEITAIYQEDGPNGERIRLVGNDVQIDVPFHVVLLTVGFGLEGTRESPVQSYWEADGLDFSGGGPPPHPGLRLG